MRRRSSRLLLAASGLATAAALATASCAHPATDRVLEPSGASGSSSAPPPSTPSSPLADAGVSPAEPVATAIAPVEAIPTDFHMVRAPEFGDGIERSQHANIFAATPAAGGSGAMGGAPPRAGGPGVAGSGGFFH